MQILADIIYAIVLLGIFAGIWMVTASTSKADRERKRRDKWTDDHIDPPGDGW